MEPAAIVTVPMSKTVDFDKIEDTAACLELIEESKERSPSKERSKTPLMSEYQQSREPMSRTESVQQICEINQKASDERDKSRQKYKKSYNDSSHGDTVERTMLENTNNVANEIAFDKKSSDLEAKVPNESDMKASIKNETSVSRDVQQLEPTENDFKKLKEKALSLDFELSNEVTNAASAKPVERRRSKIFETAEKFNQLSSTAENEKPKKIFIPGVNVGGAKRAFERKASLSSVTTPPPMKASASKVIIDVPTANKKGEKDEQKQTLGNRETVATEDKRDEAKKRAIDIISGAIGKPPMRNKLNGSPPLTPQSTDSKKLGLKIQVAPNDVRSATVSVSTPIETKFGLDVKSAAPEAAVSTKLKGCY